MPSSFRRPLLALTAATGGLLAALSSSAIANADQWEIVEFGDHIVSAGGMPPFYQSVVEQGPFSVIDIPGGPGSSNALSGVDGIDSSTVTLGMSNENFVVSDDAVSDVYPAHSVFDITKFAGLENDYVDIVGKGPDGANEISDTLITPFGNFNIPTTFDAASGGAINPLAGAAEPAAAAAAPADLMTEPIPGDPGFTFIPDPEDGTLTITSTTGLAPLFTTVEENGFFIVNDFGAVGNASFYSDMFGDHNVLFDRFFNGDVVQVIDQFNFGSSGFENVYSDVVGGAPDGSNLITDTFVTPFGDFNIPTLYDAAAVFDAGNFAPAAATDWLGALEADWTTLVTDFSALF